MTKAPGAIRVVVPEALEGWHPIAAAWFESLAMSGQAKYYEPSDWATAVYVAEAMSRGLAASRFSSQLFAAVLSGMSTLLVTEGDRRRVQLELTRHAGVDEDEAAAEAATLHLMRTLEQQDRKERLIRNDRGDSA